MTSSTTLSTRQVIETLAATRLDGFDGCLASYRDEAWVVLPNGQTRDLPLAYRKEYGSSYQEPYERPCDPDGIARLVRRAERVVVQFENCQDGGSVDSYTLYSRCTDNPQRWVESVEYPED
ncbi:hypothetical protein [Cardiobacterium valvarum]|nr:hypothetical protein [Cardiobacterium valvarum]